MTAGVLLAMGLTVAAGDDAVRRDRLAEKIADLTRRIAANPGDARLYVARGTTFLEADRMEESIADLDKAIAIDPALEDWCWQRGIAYYYAGRYQESARQFELYYRHDKVDRENGVWRYLAQAKQQGVAQARKNLLAYEEDDRPPLTDVYRMFAGTLEPEALLAKFAGAEDGARGERFYAELYVGLFLDSIGKAKEAKPHLERAVADEWGRNAGGGPGVMWAIARLHLARLDRSICKEEAARKK